ncbi:unnamed protein product [Ectocarpus sp. CCAP 1310/34]|nr:unnamed protein product [Ectocarpus sp. CCAP 1310/34]
MTRGGQQAERTCGARPKFIFFSHQYHMLLLVGGFITNQRLHS